MGMKVLVVETAMLLENNSCQVRVVKSYKFEGAGVSQIPENGLIVTGRNTYLPYITTKLPAESERY